MKANIKLFPAIQNNTSYHQQNQTRRNIKGSTSYEMKIVPDGNLDLFTGVKTLELAYT